MVTSPKPLYHNPQLHGIINASSLGDGYSVQISWREAFYFTTEFDVVYNIYYSENKKDLYTGGVRAVIIDNKTLLANIVGLKPGSLYYFSVRASLQYASRSQLSSLPVDDEGCYYYPESVLAADITDTDLEIEVSDIETYPPLGVIQLGAELIAYSSIDIPDSKLIIASGDRGFAGTTATLHQTDGYDGTVYRDPLVKFFTGYDDGNTYIVTEQSKFDGKYAKTEVDGFKISEDLVTSKQKFIEADESGIDLLPYDFAGWRRTDPIDLLSGKCVGSYFGGEHYCADGYGGIGNKIRGIGFSDHNNQREEVLLNTTGFPVMLLRRQYEGVLNPQVTTIRESAPFRSPSSFGTEFDTGFEQFFNPKRSDGKIMVRFGPTLEDIDQRDDGRESVFIPDCWTLTYPTIKDRDVIITFNNDGSEDFRYEILNVTRNNLISGEFGAQKFTARRLRKTDSIYSFRVNYDEPTMPSLLNTGIGMVAGFMAPHVHTIQVSENINSLAQVNGTTSVSLGHSHPIINGVVQEIADHTHTIIL